MRGGILETFWDFVILLLSQIGGGPGPKENNLVRFALPAVLWTGLLLVAWNRQRTQNLPRERLLVWGFGLGLTRELFMFAHTSLQLFDLDIYFLSRNHLIEPLEHTFTMAAVVVVAGAFLRYLLDDEKIARRYLQVGLVVTGVTFLVTWLWWLGYAPSHPEARFNRTVSGVSFHLLNAAFAAAAIVLLSRKKGWLRNIVSLALSFYVVAGPLRLVNYLTQGDHAAVLCPICNSLHIFAIPLLGYVYLREQAIEKQRAEEALSAYRDQLEHLVEERTMELTRANERLQQEVAERKQAEMAIIQRNSELAAQNAIAATISRSLDMDQVLDTALDTVLSVLEMDSGCIFLLDPDDPRRLRLHTYRGQLGLSLAPEMTEQSCSCACASQRAVTEMQPVVIRVEDHDPDCCSPVVVGEGLQSLAAIPLMSKGKALGAITLGTRQPEMISETSLDLLTGMGQQIGMVIENANLYQETENWANELTLLHQVSVVLSSTLEPDEIYHHVAEQSAKLVGCQATLICSWDSELKEAVPVATYGLAEVAIEGLRLTWSENAGLLEPLIQRSSVAIEDARVDGRIPDLWRRRMDVRGFLGVPVWTTDEPLAVLCLIDQQRPRTWRRADIELVESFVNRAALALENAYLHKRLQWAAALEERQRIAAEMHDGLAQTLSYLAFRAFNAMELLKQGNVEAALTEHEVIDKTIALATTEVRRSITSLQEGPTPRRPLEEWLADAVEQHLGEYSQPPVELELPEHDPLYLPPDHIEQVVKVLREALLNIHHHAAARKATVRLQERGGWLYLTIEDDGRGFDVEAPMTDGRKHFGLNIMRARAARIGGRLGIHSTPGQGTRVVLSWRPNGRPASS